MLGSLFKHFSNYSLGSLLVILAGFVSFPILTRLLSVAEYGLLALVTTTLGFMVAVGKMGLQHSTILCYSDTAEGKNDWGLSSFYATVIFGMGGISAVMMMLWFIFTSAFADRIWDDANVATVFMLISPIIVIRVVYSALVNFMRAQERSGVLTLTTVLQRWGSLALTLLGLFFIEPTLKVFFSAVITAESIVLITLFATVFRSVSIRPANFSRTVFTSLLVIGLPMFGYELAGIFVNLGDRYVISLMLNNEELGKYAAAYNLTEYASSLIVLSLKSAVLPMYLRYWAQDGEAKTKSFIEKTLGYYVLLALPMAVLFSAVGPDLIELLASSKYLEGATIIPYVISGMLIEGSAILLAAGLYVEKRTKTLMLVLALSAAVNLSLNLVLVPLYGIKGAAIATTFTYLVYAALSYVVAGRMLRIRIPYKVLLVGLVAAIAAYFSIHQVVLDNAVLNIVMKVLVGCVVYAGLVLLFDANIRTVLRGLIAGRLSGKQ